MSPNPVASNESDEKPFMSCKSSSRRYTEPMPPADTHNSESPAGGASFESEVVRAVFGERTEELRDERLLVKCQSFWPDIAGGFSKHSRPHRVRGDRLYVRLENPVYKTDLQLMSREILTRIRRLTGGELSRLVVDQGRIDWTDAPAQAPDERPTDAYGKTAPEDLNDGQKELLEGLGQITGK